ncbi:bifunctional [glutamate--ammonia ligase]-adenylyl-L-tyrosine phosphorylase/[glutamate--ammonia-ligase] adenylyltransferase [Thauera sp.]|jgi:glutamate-ammonia-ligase adenylyltransferase|uniref:bifunctional [glutamate--ammonia ligase]-adenylyl-L-tyrosine phosphorylase/[glutamate--ammonia-ligase] adenylyltransferase n=1 Tax=Thauera sp. TaxID=1905334 RepID=UPI002A35C6DC|nr:bifunctional [glutamate--ammonia ligase]-adenylyl-L-tyrosine phosphorylase/[glutamate--ammonia-ligase] adenylyltransferase [Thauera sp.]MDX9884357.1 bifunctional [glutamate--ammonia ligase]-adenylyl-L-tyrosine phosphorylase/[glutamate--ammonia-ligase] adenylyltransferase [Thauera sp.]
MPSLPDALPQPVQTARRLSRYLSRMVDSQPWLGAALAESISQPIGEADMQRFLAAREVVFGGADGALRPALRQLRIWVLCHLIVRDLACNAELSEVTETMTVLAEVSIRHAHDVLRAALVERYGQPLSPTGWEQELLVVGMGKLGGRELNVSSDIDLIFIYPEDGDTGGKKVISNYEFFERLGKQLIQALNDVTEHGQVFRVDMRLRPNGDSGPLVCCFDMLENYFVTQGREWERYAWIKGRVLRGERWSELRNIARPFVFRKYLDFGAINAMRELHAQIRREVARRDRANNVKLGPGGIREIEFIAQVFQLIRGGRDIALQVRPTLKVLALLPERGILSAQAVDELTAAYVFLRRLEHRLQYLDDAQTHDLPTKEADQALIAEAMGFADYPALLGALDAQRKVVSDQFDSVFGDPSEEDHSLDAAWTNAEDTEATTAALGELGYRRPQVGAERLAAIHCSPRYSQLPNNIRSRFDALMPRMIEVAAATPGPDDTLTRLLDLIEAIGRRGAYLALLQQYPQALRRVADLMSASRWGAQFLTRHPILLDEMLDARNLDSTPDWRAFRANLAAELDALEPDMERQMDVMREQHHAQVFRLLTQDIAGLLTVEKLADHLSELADIVLDLTLPLCWRRIKIRHRPEPRFSVISYGKLGGKELGYASDLDIVFLFDDDAPEAAEVYTRLAQRTNTWLSSQTAAGQLFDTDLRLRPNGESGLIVTSLEAFRKYQMESAWVWEHQALTRARFSAGDRAIGEAFERIRCEVLRMKRDLDALRAEVLAMRKKMRDAHASKDALFDLKHDAGGLIDVEFLIQYLVLGHSHDHAQLTGNLGNIALLRIAGELGLIPTELAAACADSYRELRRLQHRQRLNDRLSRIDPDEAETAREPVRALWRHVFGE